MLPRVAIVGRPNVGKSSLVNRILGRRAAITQELPGVTRDQVSYPAEWSGRAFMLLDTGGWEARVQGLAAQVAAQAERGMREADLVVLVVDAIVGVTQDDAAVAARLQRSPVPVVLVANKVDGAAQEAELPRLWSLGLGEPYGVSAVHGRGLGDLLDALIERLPRHAAPEAVGTAGAVALVGRPNVGKSSLFNRLGGGDLAIVDDAPGTTRDSVDTLVEHDGQTWRFVDTAGMRRHMRHASGTDYYALVRSLEAIARADVALLVLDAPAGVTEDDQKVAAQAVEAGCALVLVANKWDLIDEEGRRQWDADMERRLGFVDWAPLVRTSALTKRGLDRLWPAIIQVVEARAHRVPTAELNSWLGSASDRTPPPPARGRAVKLRYATQVAVDPPEVLVFTNGALSPSYRRYLEHGLRATFGFVGTPVRVRVRTRSSEDAQRKPRAPQGEREET